MIVCTNCGNHNEDSDEFCGSCGKFLEWVGERIEAPAPAPEPVVEDEPEAVKVGFVDRVKAAVGIDEASRPVEAGVPVGAGGGGGGGGSLPAEPETEVDPDLELQRAAEEAAAAETARQEAEAAEAARRAAIAQEEAEARAAAEAEAARAAEEAARVAAEDRARAEAEAERMRQQQAEAEARQREEAAARAAAEAEAAAAEAAAQAAAEEQARAEAEAEQMRQQQTEAEQQAQREATERATAEAERLRQEQTEKAAALEAAKRAEEAARAAAEAEAKARAEAEQKAREEAEAARAAQEEARRRAEDEARAKAAAEARAREEEEARKRAAALLARPKAGATPVAEPVIDEPVGAASTASSAAAMTPAAAAAAAAQRPVAQTPVAQQPTTVKQPPRPDPKVTAVEQAIKPGDLVCSQCGSGNDPARKFCRKCGNSLAQAVTAVKLPWWKRIFGGKKSGGRVSKDATEKQRQRQKAKDASFKAQMAMANVRKAAMVLMMLGLVGGFAIPSVRGEVMRRSKDGFTSVQELFNPQVSPVNPIAVASTSAVAGKEANLAADLVVNSFWAEGAEGDGVGQTISFTFAEPTDLSKVLITGGSTDTPENYVNNPRPKALHLVFDTGGSADLNLIDAEFRKSQGFNLKGAKAVTKVDIVISSVYPGRGGTETGIAEVEFKKKG